MSACKNIVGRIKKALGIISVATVQMLFGLQVSAQDFGYTGQVQTFTASQTGKYKVTLNGAAGGHEKGKGSLVGTGGYFEGYLNLNAGDVIYIAVGGQGGQNHGGWNGGGQASNNAYGGGGATSAYTQLIGDGQLVNYKDSKQSIIAVAGGGGGIAQHWVVASVNYYKNYIDAVGISSGYVGIASGARYDSVGRDFYAMGATQNSGYAFGKGQQTLSTCVNNGTGGAGGGGYYGGFASVDGMAGGAGGSGTNFKLYDVQEGTRSYGNGSASITYIGAYEQTIIVDPNKCGTYDGSQTAITLKGSAGSSYYIGTPQPASGYTFMGWQKIDKSGIQNIGNSASGTYGFETVTYKAIWKDSLTLYPSMITGQGNTGYSMNLYLKENDEYNKSYNVLYQTNNQTWNLLNATSEGFQFQNGTERGSLQSNGQIQMKSGKYSLSLRGATGGPYGSANVGYGGQQTGEYTNQQAGSTLYFKIGGHGNGQSGGSGGGGHGGSGGWNSSDGGYTAQPGGGGGGGSFIQLVDSLSNGDKSNLLLAAGGGGGVAGAVGNNTWMQYYLGLGGGGETGQPCQYQNPGTQTGGGAGIGGQGAGGWLYGGTGRHGTDGSAQSEGGGGGGGGMYGASGSTAVCGATGGQGFVNGSKIQSGSTVQGNRGSQYYNGQASWAYYNSSQTLPQITNIQVSDTAAPNAPKQNGSQLRYSGQNIIADIIEQGDKGQTTYFKAQSYDSDTGNKLNDQNTLTYNVTTGVAKFIYKIDYNNSTTITSGTDCQGYYKDGNAKLCASVTLTGDQRDRYLHVAAVDGAGNVGPTCHIHIPSYVVITYNKNSSQATGTDNQTQTVGFGETATIKKITDIGVQNDGYRFKAWNNKQDGSGSYSYYEGDRVQYNTLVQRHGYSVTLYAQWERTYWLSVDPNNGSWLDKHDIVRNGTNTSDFQTTATNKTYTNVARFKMGQGDTKTILDAVRLGYNFKGWRISRA